MLIWPMGFNPGHVLPISLAYLKSNMPARHEVRIFDCALNQRDADSQEFARAVKDFDPQVAALCTWSPFYPEAVRLIDRIKKINPKIITVMGGNHVTSYPDSVMENPKLDFALRGEAEFAFPAFIDELESQGRDWGKSSGLVYRKEDRTLVKNPMQFEQNLDAIRIPDYDFIQIEKYFSLHHYRCATRRKRNAPIWITRGCPYRCTFCEAPALNGKPVRVHSVDYVIAWIRFLYFQRGISAINIVDDNFTYHVEYAKELCRAIINLGIPDLFMGSPNGIRAQRSDPELFRLMKQAGWEVVQIAPESGSVNTLKRMKKDHDLATILVKAREIREAGLKVHAFFILGYPGDTKEDVKATLKFIKKMKVDFPAFNLFQPLPGTPIYNQLVQDGEIENGLLPNDYSVGRMPYVTKGLRGINFSWLILKCYLLFFLRNPHKFPHVFTYSNTGLVLKKLFLNIVNLFRKRRDLVRQAQDLHLQFGPIAPHS